MEEQEVCIVCGEDATRQFLNTSVLICENVVCEVVVREDLELVYAMAPKGNK